MPDNDAIWERGWDGHDREQLIRLARLPLPQKLQWLEEAHRLVRQLKGDVPSTRSPSGKTSRNQDDVPSSP